MKVPSTQGFKYAGSKLKILPFILELAERTGAKHIFDGFSGTTRVSQAFAKSGYRVTSNDIGEWSYHFANSFLNNTTPSSDYENLIAHLNHLDPVDGWFTDHYGGDPDQNEPDQPKKPWQIRNTRQLDAIREEIDRLNLDSITHSVALVSLMLALDKVDSTLGHHVSYLREWAARSHRKIELKVPELWINQQKNTVGKADIFDAVRGLECDLAYYDPPYGSNNEKMPPSRVRYAGYYHLWTTVCLNDRPEVFGKAGRRTDSSDLISASVFEDFRKLKSGQFVAVNAIDRLLKMTPCEWIILSYSSGGRATSEQLNDCIHSYGVLVDSLELTYKRHIMASMQSTRDWLRDDESSNREFLFLIRKS
jgi:adenine-specific DNA-methyltransferase